MKKVMETLLGQRGSLIGKHGVSILVVFFMWATIMSAYAAEIFEMPAPKEGDRWEFKASTKEGITSTTDVLNGSYEVVFMQGRLEVFQIAAGQKTAVSVGVAEDLKRMIASGQDDLQFLNFPLSVGKKWNAAYRHTQAGARRPQRRSATFQVEKLEQLKIDAGAFQALRIKGTGQTSGGGVTREWDYFYSPDTKGIVKFYYDSGVGTKSGKIEIELTKFSSSGQ